MIVCHMLLRSQIEKEEAVNQHLPSILHLSVRVSGSRVLILDLDTQGHAGIGCGVPSVKRGEATAHDFLLKNSPRTLSEAIRPTIIENVHIAPAHQTLDPLEVRAESTLLSEALQAEEQTLKKYDIILVDTPPSLDVILLNTLNAAHHVLVPFLPHYLSFAGIKQLTRLLFKVKIDANPNINILGFIPIQSDSRILIHRKIMDEISSQFGQGKVLRVIRNDIRLVEAMMVGKPVGMYAPTARATFDYRWLTSQILSVL